MARPTPEALGDGRRAKPPAPGAKRCGGVASDAEGGRASPDPLDFVLDGDGDDGATSAGACGRGFAKGPIET